MPTKTLVHSAVLALALGLSYFIAKTSLSEYSLQISGLFVALYMLISFLAQKKFLSPASRVPFDIFVFSFAVSFLLFTTGGFTSPLYFLTYFLLFGIALLSAPMTAIIAALCFVILFVISPRSDFWAEVLQIISLLAIAPISAMFGKQFLQVLRDEQKIKVLKNVSRDFQEEIKFQENEVKSWTEGDFREKLVTIQTYLDQLLKDPALGNEKKNKIKELYEEIYNLFKSGMEMKKEVGK